MNVGAADWPLRIPRPCPVRPAFLIALAILLSAWNAAVVFLAFSEPRRWFAPAWWLADRTRDLVSLTLSANVVSFVLFVGLLLLAGRQTLRGLGLDPRRLPAGLGVSLAAYGAVLVVQVVAAGSSLEWHPAWSQWPRAAGIWLGQFCGNAAFEEVMYRGFFLPQAYLLIGPTRRPWVRLALALLISQGLFAAIHVPVNVWKGKPTLALLPQFAAGLLLAGIYLRTGNLFLAIGLHALMNHPPSPIVEPFPSGVAIGLVAVGMLVFPPITPVQPSSSADD